MAHLRRRWRGRAWGALGAAALLGGAALVLRDPRRRAEARRTARRAAGTAQEAGDRLRETAGSAPGGGRGALAAILLARALIGRGVMRLVFGALGLAVLRRALLASDRGRAAAGRAGRVVRGLTGTLRGLAVGPSGGGAEQAPTLLGPDERPVRA